MAAPAILPCSSCPLAPMVVFMTQDALLADAAAVQWPGVGARRLLRRLRLWPSVAACRCHAPGGSRTTVPLPRCLAGRAWRTRSSSDSKTCFVQFLCRLPGVGSAGGGRLSARCDPGGGHVGRRSTADGGQAGGLWRGPCLSFRNYNCGAAEFRRYFDTGVFPPAIPVAAGTFSSAGGEDCALSGPEKGSTCGAMHPDGYLQPCSALWPSGWAESSARCTLICHCSSSAGAACIVDSGKNRMSGTANRIHRQPTRRGNHFDHLQIRLTKKRRAAFGPGNVAVLGLLCCCHGTGLDRHSHRCGLISADRCATGSGFCGGRAGNRFFLIRFHSTTAIAKPWTELGEALRVLLLLATLDLAGWRSRAGIRPGCGGPSFPLAAAFVPLGTQPGAPDHAKPALRATAH